MNKIPHPAIIMPENGNWRCYRNEEHRLYGSSNMVRVIKS